jgi:hypothetical protein
LRGQKALFVLANTSDGDTRGKVVASLASALANDAFIDSARIVAEPNWTLKDFVDQCNALPGGVEGAFIVNLAAVSPGQYQGWFFIRSYVEVAGNVLYAECTSEGVGPKLKGVAAYTWASNVEDQAFERSQPNYLPTMSALFTIATAYIAFAPSKSNQSVSTRVFRTPSPIPPSGAVSNVTTTTSSQTNPASQASGINTVTGALAGYAIAAPNATPPPPSSALSWNAIDRLVYDLVSAIGCHNSRDNTSERRPTQFGPASPVCATPTPAGTFNPQPSPSPVSTPTHVP